MKPDGTRVIGMLVFALLVVAGAGCERGGPTPDTVAVSPDTTRRAVEQRAQPPDTTSAMIVAEAESRYTYGKERPPLTFRYRDFRGHVVPDDSLPKMWISTATLKDSTTRPPHRIIARLRSAGAYPPAGIDSGYNYVWRNSWDTTTAATWVTKVVPRDTTAAQYVLTLDPRHQEYTHGMSPKEPRLVRISVHSVAFGTCLDDPRCPTGHCGYY